MKGLDGSGHTGFLDHSLDERTHAVTRRTIPDDLHEDAAFLASNLDPSSTGVPGATIWIFAGEPTRSESGLGPRIWVVAGAGLEVESLSDAVVVTLSAPPEALGTLTPETARKALEFVEVNRDVLIRYWRGRMGTQQMLDLLARV